MRVHRNYRRNRRPSARALLIAAASEDIEGLSPAGRAVCRELLHLADSLSASSRPHHNLSIYLFEYAAWFRELLTPELQESFAGRRARATLGQIFDLAASFALRGISGEDVSTRAFLSYLRAAVDSGGLDTTDDLPPGGEALAVLTVHRSKGLEWPVVFVPFAAEGTYPLKERDPEIELPPGMAHTLDIDDTHLRDEACLFYVAITRARNRLVLSYAQKYGARKPAVSPFVAPLLSTMRSQGRLLEHPLTLGTLDEDDDIPRVNGGGPENAPWPLGDEVGEFLLKTYLSCPRRFAFTCIYGIEDEDRAYRSFQRVVFEAAQDPVNFETLWEEHGPSADHWQTPFLHHKAQRLLQQATGPLAGADSPCVKHQQTRSIRLGSTEDGRERRTTMKIHREQEKPDGSLAISYINTSGKPSRSAPDDDRFVLYSLYASEVAPGKSNEISIEYIETGESRPATFTPLVQKNRQKKLLKAIQAIELGDMAPRQGNGCGNCPYIPLCSVGKKIDF